MHNTRLKKFEQLMAGTYGKYVLEIYDLHKIEWKKSNTVLEAIE